MTDEKIHDGSSDDPEKVAHLTPQATIQDGEVKEPRFVNADLNDGDVALKAFVGHEGETIVMTPEAEKALLRKIDWNLMPVCIYARKVWNYADYV